MNTLFDIIISLLLSIVIICQIVFVIMFMLHGIFI